RRRRRAMPMHPGRPTSPRIVPTSAAGGRSAAASAVVARVSSSKDDLGAHQELVLNAIARVVVDGQPVGHALQIVTLDAVVQAQRPCRNAVPFDVTAPIEHLPLAYRLPAFRHEEERSLSITATRFDDRSRDVVRGLVARL